MTPKRDRVREPVQVYLDPDDRALLDALATRTGLARAEVLRRGVRALAQQALGERRPGAALDVLTGALGTGTDLPRDLAARHDEYLIRAPRARRGRPRRR